MADRRSKFAIASASVLTAGYSYEIVSATINLEPTSPVLYIGLVCGIGLLVSEMYYMRKKLRNHDVRSTAPKAN